MIARAIIAKGFDFKNGKILINKTGIRLLFNSAQFRNSNDAYFFWDDIRLILGQTPITQLPNSFFWCALFAVGNREPELLNNLTNHVKDILRPKLSSIIKNTEQLSSAQLKIQVYHVLSIVRVECGQGISEILRLQLLQLFPDLESSYEIPINSQKDFYTFCSQFLQPGRKRIAELIRNNVNIHTYKVYIAEQFVKEKEARHRYSMSPMASKLHDLFCSLIEKHTIAINGEIYISKLAMEMIFGNYTYRSLVPIQLNEDNFYRINDMKKTHLRYTAMAQFHRNFLGNFDNYIRPDLSSTSILFELRLASIINNHKFHRSTFRDYNKNYAADVLDKKTISLSIISNLIKDAANRDFQEFVFKKLEDGKIETELDLESFVAFEKQLLEFKSITSEELLQHLAQ